MIKSFVFLFAFFILSAWSFAQADLQKDSSSVNDAQQADTTYTQAQLPIFSMSGDDVEADLDNQDASSLLQASRDVFVQAASFQFGVARYRMRGLSSKNQQVMINSVNVMNPEFGKP